MNFKNLVLSLVMLGTVATAVPAVADAAVSTPTYKGKKIHWEYGRTLQVYSYSTVQTGHFTHSATANSTFSGWKSPGVTATASQFVGTGTAYAYWSCK